MVTTKFNIGDRLSTENYETGRTLKIEVVKRDEKWAWININGKIIKQVRINKVKNPEGESILISDCAPIFSFSSEDY